jgi:hypothetical protein
VPRVRVTFADAVCTGPERSVMATRTGAEPWDTKWAAEKAADALRYLRRNFP